MARSRFPLFIPQRIAVHHSASRRSTTFAEVRRWHLARGWPEIGYNHVINQHGVGTPGRIVPQRAAAVARANTGTLSVLVMGDNTKPAQRWTQEQVDHLLGYLGACFTIWPHLEGQVFGHRDLAVAGHATQCPGLDIAALIALDWQVESYWRAHSRG